jgi:hemolysin-activating ACP:hemolysin acyltransferase
MSTSQVVNSASQTNDPSASLVDGLKAGMVRDLSAQPDAGSASSLPSQTTANGKPGLTEKVRRDAAVLRNALAFTQVVGVLMRSPHYRQYTLGDLEWLVIPPVMAGQFRIGEAKPANNQGTAVPVAVVLWASVSPEVDKRLMEGSNASFQLKPEEWKSGDIPWLVHAAGETRFVRFVVDQLAKTTFKGRKVKVRGRDQDGNLKVHVLDGTTSK